MVTVTLTNVLDKPSSCHPVNSHTHNLGLSEPTSGPIVCTMDTVELIQLIEESVVTNKDFIPIIVVRVSTTNVNCSMSHSS